MSKYINLSKGLLLTVFIFASSVGIAQIKANQNNATLAFAGEHVGMQFNGVFEKWQATLILPPVLEPSVNASFDVSSAKTGDSTYDSTLPEGDWFDVENHPQAKFVSTNVNKSTKGYEVEGIFTLKGIEQVLTFTLEDEGASLVARFNIDRLAHNIGTDSDPDADWVSQYIAMEVTITK